MELPSTAAYISTNSKPHGLSIDSLVYVLEPFLPHE